MHTALEYGKKAPFAWCLLEFNGKVMKTAFDGAAECFKKMGDLCGQISKKDYAKVFWLQRPHRAKGRVGSSGSSVCC